MTEWQQQLPFSDCLMTTTNTHLPLALHQKPCPPNSGMRIAKATTLTTTLSFPLWCDWLEQCCAASISIDDCTINVTNFDSVYF